MTKSNRNVPQNQPIRKTEFCNGCKYLGTEEFSAEKTALICTSEEEEHAGRVLEIIKTVWLKNAHPLKPAWCKNGRYLPETEEEE